MPSWKRAAAAMHSSGRPRKLLRPARLIEIIAIDGDRHRTVVDERHRHLRAEYARGDGDTTCCERRTERIDERCSDFRRGGSGEARPTALTHIREQRELRHHERRATHIKQRLIESPGGVREDAHLGDLASDAAGGVGVVTRCNSDEYEKADADLTNDGVVGRNARAGDALVTRWMTTRTGYFAEGFSVVLVFAGVLLVSSAFAAGAGASCEWPPAPCEWP